MPCQNTFAKRVSQHDTARHSTGGIYTGKKAVPCHADTLYFPSVNGIWNPLLFWRMLVPSLSSLKFQEFLLGTVKMAGWKNSSRKTEWYVFGARWALASKFLCGVHTNATLWTLSSPSLSITPTVRSVSSLLDSQNNFNQPISHGINHSRRLIENYMMNGWQRERSPLHWLGTCVYQASHLSSSGWRLLRMLAELLWIQMDRRMTTFAAFKLTE